MYKKLVIVLVIILLLNSCGKTTIIDDETAVNDNRQSFLSETESKSYNNESQRVEEFDYVQEDIVLNNEVEILADNDITDIVDGIETFDFKATDWYWPNLNIEDVLNISDTVIRYEIDGQYTKYLPPINNDIALEDMLYECGATIIQLYSGISEYDIESTLNSKGFKALYDNGLTQSNYPIIFLRHLEGAHYYTVQKVNSGGWMYVFFDGVRYSGTGKYVSDDITDIDCIGGVYLENVLEYSAFNQIKVGESKLEDVGKVDSNVYAYLLAYLTEVTHGGRAIPSSFKDKFSSRHLLTDGLLTIYYEKQNGTYIVSDIEFSEDYIFNSKFVKEVFGVDFPKQYKILPQDYPPAS